MVESCKTLAHARCQQEYAEKAGSTLTTQMVQSVRYLQTQMNSLLHFTLKDLLPPVGEEDPSLRESRDPPLLGPIVMVSTVTPKEPVALGM